MRKKLLIMKLKVRAGQADRRMMIVRLEKKIKIGCSKQGTKQPSEQWGSNIPNSQEITHQTTVQRQHETDVS
jgi:hypothetical protein